MFQSSRTSLNLTRRSVLLSGAASLMLMGNIKAPSMAAPKAGEVGRVIRVIDGDSFVLGLDDGSELSVRLSAIQAPRRATQTRKTWPQAAEAKAGLEGLIQGRRVQLFYGNETRDRFNRAIAQVYSLNANDEADLWAQREMVRLGLARVFTWKGELGDIATLYGEEIDARDHKRGIWGNEFYFVRKPDPDPLAQFVDSLQIVEGIVISTADVRGRIYLNFGSDYKTDFTIAIAKRNAKHFAAMNPVSLTGARVRVRGWIEMINGPMIWADHPERLEILT